MNSELRTVLLFGAGKSSTCLIDYLLKEIVENNWILVVCDADLALAERKIPGTNKASAISIDVQNDVARATIIESADLVISMLPPSLHFLIAKDCVKFGKNLLNASYVDDNLRSLEKEIIKKKLLFLCEMGLDPGIDHMSAMQLIDVIKQQGGTIRSFKSHCGGLVAPESDTNPWHYKVSWNPRNIVLAGSDGAEFLVHSKIRTVPYTTVFKDAQPVTIPGYDLCWYPNRNSLHYIPLYALEGIHTFIRTTLRHPAFCRGWSKIVNIGLTNRADFELIKNCKTLKDWFKIKTEASGLHGKDWSAGSALNNADSFNDEFRSQISFLNLESSDPLPPNFQCSAEILQSLIESKLQLKETDHDMIVMMHEFEYDVTGKKHTISSTLIVKGTDSSRTAMAKTVGLPLGIAAKLILQDKLKLTGLLIPTVPEIYNAVLPELEKHGIRFERT